MVVPTPQPGGVAGGRVAPALLVGVVVGEVVDVLVVVLGEVVLMLPLVEGLVAVVVVEEVVDGEVVDVAPVVDVGLVVMMPLEVRVVPFGQLAAVLVALGVVLVELGAGVMPGRVEVLFWPGVVVVIVPGVPVVVAPGEAVVGAGEAVEGFGEAVVGACVVPVTEVEPVPAAPAPACASAMPVASRIANARVVILCVMTSSPEAARAGVAGRRHGMAACFQV